MDYTKIPRPLIYKMRENLNDFGVQTPGSLNQKLFSHLKKILKGMEGALGLYLRCFNDAYYVCTLILKDEFPDSRIADYEKLILDENQPYAQNVCAAAMGMVCHLLKAYDAQWKLESKDEVIEAIRYRFSHFYWHDSLTRLSFEKMLDNFNADGLSVSRGEFAPRDITEAIEHLGEVFLAENVQAVCELLTLLDNPRRQAYGADLAIARMKDYLRENFGVNPDDPSDLPDCVAGDSLSLDLYWSMRNAVDYIKEHYPQNLHPRNQFPAPPDGGGQIGLLPLFKGVDMLKLYMEGQFGGSSDDVPSLQARIAELEKENSHLKDQLAQRQPSSGNEEIEAQRKEVEKLIREVDSLKEEIADMEKRVGIDAPKAALLVRIACSKVGGLPSNRENAWPLISNLWGSSETNARKRLKEAVKMSTVEALAKLFDDVSPKIASIIREEGGKIVENQKKS